MHRQARLILLAVCLALLAACANDRPLVTPLRTIEQPAPCGAADTLVVMLPGSYSHPEDFIREGFVRTLRERQVDVDILLVDAQVGYYENRTIVDRLHADVMQPARARGIRHVWLVGISIGAVGAMLYAEEHPRELEGVVLLAPYLGSRIFTLDIENAGGLAAWQAPARRADEDVDPRLWRWLKAQTDGGPDARPIAIYQGYGADDRFAYNNRLLSRSLPADRVFTVPGGHDWSAWNALWQRIAPRLPLAPQGQCRAAEGAAPITPSAPRP